MVWTWRKSPPCWKRNEHPGAGGPLGGGGHPPFGGRALWLLSPGGPFRPAGLPGEEASAPGWIGHPPAAALLWRGVSGAQPGPVRPL